MRRLHAFIFLPVIVVVILAAGGCPQPSPETAVLGEQEWSPDYNPSTDNNTVAGTDQPPSITNATVTGTLTEGQPSMIVLSCVASDPAGALQSVTADLSIFGGAKAQALSPYGSLWSWSGQVTPTITGPVAIPLTAISQSNMTTTTTATTQVIPASQTATSPSAGSPTTQPGEPGDNIALGRPYTWNIAPNYPGCTDPGDKTQLTDGKRTQYTTNSCFWTQKSTVGWANRNEYVAITIDLGQIQPIKGALFSTAAGISGTSIVNWPSMIGIMVSDDGTNYYDVGDLVCLGAEHGLPALGSNTTYSYWTDRLATHGQFVKIVVTGYPCISADEIEVYRGDNTLLTQKLGGTPVSDISGFVQNHRVQSGIVRRITSDAHQVMQQITAATGLKQTQANLLTSELATICDQALHLPNVSDPSTFRAILPLNDLHARVFRVAASLWQAQGLTGLVAWQGALWDPLSPTQTPAVSQPIVNVAMMQNEFRAGAFDLSNATDTDMTINMKLLGLPGGPNPSYVTVHEVAWTDTQLGTPVAAALPEAVHSNDGFTLHIPSGITRQVWLTFHPSDVPSGTYEGTIIVDSGTGGKASIPLHLRLSSLQFPSQPTLSLGGWDYTDAQGNEIIRSVTSSNRDALISHLQTHFVDTTWGSTDVMRARPGDPDFTRFDAWALRWPNVRNYRIALDAGTSFGGFPTGTSDFDKAVGAWISAWVAHWRGMGIRPDQIALLLVDEPQASDQYRRLIAWSKAIHAANTGVQIWEDQFYTGPGTYNNPTECKPALNASDILCPDRTYFMICNLWQTAYRQQLAAGKKLDFYSALGPSQMLDPYSYYRLQAWTCWQEKAGAMHYWAFGDTAGASSWNEYLSVGSYSPLYLDDGSVTAAKQMEAIREGVEDYEYMVMLKNRISQLKATGNLPAQVAAAETLLAQTGNRVLNARDADKLYWCQDKDRGVADQVRTEVLNMLETLGPPDAVYAEPR